MITVFSWIVLLVALAVVYSASRFLVRIRGYSNAIGAAAATEYAQSVGALLETADELPDEVLAVLEIMNKSANSSVGRKALLGVLQGKMMKEPKNSRLGTKEEFANQVESMRPELQDLFNKSIVSWLNYITHQSLLVQARMLFVMMSSQSRELDPTTAHRKAGLSILSNLNPNHC